MDPLKCSICGQAIAAGTRFCSDCKRALKRARDDTVSQFQLAPAASTPDPAATAVPGIALATPMAAPGSPEATPPPLAWPSPRRVAWATVAVLLLAGTVLAYRVLQATIGQEREAVAQLAVESAPPAPPIAAEPRPGERVVVDPAAGARESPAVPDRVAEWRLPVPPQPDELRPLPIPPVPEPARTARPRTVTPEAAVAPAAPAPPATAVLAPPAAVPATRPLPRADRWQQLEAALARCASEGFLSRVVCEQRTRLNYCEGYWGQVAQCPSGIANDHGQ